ncbi:MAG: LemA family protein [Bacteroidales bacterium]|nr:LemA family protein [Bacteroidales bacterium]MBP5135116.1 LemA family protein [Paludibacteraceae bacterium]
MKKTIIGIAIVAVLAFWAMGNYNKMVTEEENVETSWGNVENQYQRRMDLIPNLVATVKGYAAHEKETFEAVIAARAKATQITIDPSNATPEQLAAYQNAQGELSQALGRLLAVSESYPDLKANQNFMALQEQLEGTENRITVARNQFNETAKGFNTLIRKFPNNIIANIFGFEKKPYFEAEAGAEKAPTVEF